MKRLLSVLTALALSTVFFAATTTFATEGEAAAESTCEAYVYPESARAQSEPVEVRARLSADVGEVTSVEADEDSGLAVGMVEVTESDSIVISVDTSSAQAGDWTLHFHGDGGVCTAQWTVEAEAATSSQ